MVYKAAYIDTDGEAVVIERVHGPRGPDTTIAPYILDGITMGKAKLVRIARKRCSFTGSKPDTAIWALHQHGYSVGVNPACPYRQQP